MNIINKERNEELTSLYSMCSTSRAYAAGIMAISPLPVSSCTGEIAIWQRSGEVGNVKEGGKAKNDQLAEW